MKILITSFFAGLLFLALLSNQNVLAEEVSFLGGSVHERDSRESTYSWDVQYLHDLNEHWAVTFSWLNEGHFENHHRDGQTLQLWGRIKPLGEELVLAAGIGPYQYYDTKWGQNTAVYEDDHGLGMISSVSATWYLNNRWFVLAQSNMINTSQSFNSFSILAGIGYQLEVPRFTDQAATSSSGTGSRQPNEITVLGGQTIVNSLDLEKSAALMLEYRRSLWRYLEWTAGCLTEGDPGPIRRYGLTTELWLVRPFFDDRLTLGAGAGPYIARDGRRSQDFGYDDEATVAGLVSISAAYQIQPPWVLRFSWNRIVTNYNRDTDVALAGIGFRF